jgi:hypothetical protein
MGEHHFKHRSFVAPARTTAKQRKLTTRGTVRIVRMTPAGRTMKHGWAKEVMQGLRLMPLFKDRSERNLWKRWKRGQLSTKKFKAIIKAKDKSAGPERPTGPEYEHHHDHDHPHEH